MTDSLIRALERRVLADPHDVEALRRLAAAVERTSGGRDAAAEARAISRDLYWLDVRMIAREFVETGQSGLPHDLVARTGRLRGPEEQGEVLGHSHWRDSRDASEALLHDIMNEVERIRDPVVMMRGEYPVRFPEHGARVRTIRVIHRDWFAVPMGATGTVTVAGRDGIGVRLDDDLSGAAGDDFDNTVMWLDDDLEDFWDEAERIA